MSLASSKKLILLKKLLLTMKRRSLRNILPSNKLISSSRLIFTDRIFFSRSYLFSKTILLLLRNISLSRQDFLRVPSLHLLREKTHYLLASFVEANYFFSWNFSSSVKRALSSLFKAKWKISSTPIW